MTHIPNLKYHQAYMVCVIEYGHAKNELGWADFHKLYAQIEWLVEIVHECINSLHTSLLHQTHLQPQHNLLLNPKQLLSNSCNTQTGIKPVAETGAEQFTSGDSAFSHIFTTLVNPISIRDYQQG